MKKVLKTMSKFEYKNVPKFTAMGTYHVNVAFEDIPYTVDRYIKTHKLQMNPDFQRGHVWTEKQQIKFVEFLLSGGYSGKDIFFNHPGWNSDYSGQMVLVDGLQRLTAVIAFMNDKIKAFDHYRSEFDRIPYDIELIFHVNYVKTRAEVLTWYIQLNEGGVVHTPEEIQRVRALLEQEK